MCVQRNPQAKLGPGATPWCPSSSVSEQKVAGARGARGSGPSWLYTPVLLPHPSQAWRSTWPFQQQRTVSCGGRWPWRGVGAHNTPQAQASPGARLDPRSPQVAAVGPLAPWGSAPPARGGTWRNRHPTGRYGRSPGSGTLSRDAQRRRHGRCTHLAPLLRQLPSGAHWSPQSPRPSWETGHIRRQQGPSLPEHKWHAVLFFIYLTNIYTKLTLCQDAV